LIKNKAVTVGQAIESILKISGDKYLNEVAVFIDKGIDKPADTYDMRYDNFAVIRYHLVRGLQYVNTPKAIELLNIAKKDLHDDVKKFAEEILNKKQPENVPFWQGVRYNKNKEYEKAIECYNNALKLKPDFFDAFLELGNTYCDIGEEREGIKYYSSALSVDPNNWFALYNRGSTYFGLGEYKKAIVDFEELLTIESDDEIIKLLNKAKQKENGSESS
jgi:tetratricopeptide (TPR) repeat protein